MGSLAAYALEEKRRLDEEKARQEAREAQEEERREKIKDKQMAKLEEKWAQERAWEAAREDEEQKRQEKEARYQARMETRVLTREIKEEANRVAEEKAERERKEAKKREEEEKAAEKIRTAIAAYSAGREKATVAEEVSTEKKKSIWKKGLDWIDQHQAEIALGVGVVVGVGAILLSGGIAAPLVAAAWVAGATAVAAGTVAAGTIGLNLHYGREWNDNLLRNVALAGGAAAVVSGGWFLLHGAMTGVGAFCSTHKVCAYGEPILNAIDKSEELSLNAKLAYQTWRHDEAGASQTALELQMEYLDGNMPGNSMANDIGIDTIREVAKYGDEAVDLVRLYGVDAAKIILQYQDDGIELLQKYGPEAIKLLQRYPDNAVNVLKVIDPNSAEKLLSSVDDDVLDYALEQEP